MSLITYWDISKEPLKEETQLTYIKEILDNFKNSHVLYLIDGFEPMNNHYWNDYLSMYNCRMVGFFSLMDGKKCTAIVMPIDSHLSLIYSILMFNEINIVNHILHNKSSKFKSNYLINRMFREHILLFDIQH